MSGDASDPEFYLRKSVVRPSAPVRHPLVRPSASPPVRQSVNLSARPPPCPPIVRPRLLVRPPACPLVHSERLSAHPSARPLTPSASYHPWSLAYKFLVVEAEHALCLSVSQDCGFSLEDPLHETHCTGGHPALVRGHGIVLDYYVVLYLVGSASRACPLCHSVSQDCGFSLEDPLHETHLNPLCIFYSCSYVDIKAKQKK